MVALTGRAHCQRQVAFYDYLPSYWVTTMGSKCFFFINIRHAMHIHLSGSSTASKVVSVLFF